MAIEQGNNLNSDKKPLTEGFPVPRQDNLRTEEPNKDRVGAEIILEAEMEKRDKLRVEKKNEEETKKQEELVTELIKNYNKGDYLEVLALNNESKKREGKENVLPEVAEEAELKSEESPIKKIYKIYGEDDIPELERKETKTKQEETSKEKESYSFDEEYIKNKIFKLLESVKQIKEFKLDIIGSKEKLILNAKIKAKKYGFTTDIELNNIFIINRDNNIELEENYLSKINATKGEKKIKKLITENMDLVGIKLKEFIEKEKGEKIEKIWIENGLLKVLSKEKSEISPTKTEKTVAPETTEEVITPEIIDERKSEINKENMTDVKFEDIPEEKGEKIEETPIIPILSKKDLKMEQKKEKEKIPTREFDTQKITEEINKKIAEEEIKNGIPFTPEQKQGLTQELYLKAKEDFQKETIESSGRLKRALTKTEEWWKKIDKKTAGKVAGKALLLSGVTIGLGTLFGINTSNFAVTALKMGGRGLTAAGLNMAVTSNLVNRFLPKKEKIPDEKKSWLKKEINLSNVASVAGIGFSALLSGGLAVPLIGVGGYAFRRILNGVFDNKIKKLENENTEESKAKAKNLKLLKSTMGGAAIIAAGLGTMAVYHHNAEIETKGGQDAEFEKQQKETKLKEEMERQVKPKQQQEQKHLEELKIKIEEGIKLKDATVHKGEGVEHAFIRQIENNQELAKELGFKGDPSDTKVLHEFAGREAHIIAIKEGYVDNAGHEVRVAEADKIAYEIKIEDGHILVEEKTIGGEILETHHEGDKFEEKVDKYESSYTKSNEIDNIPEIKEDVNSSVEPDINKQIISEYEDTPENETRTEYEDTSKPEGEENITSQESTNNPYHLSDDILEKVNQTYQNNIENISPENPEVFKHIQLSAEETTKQNLDTVNQTYKPIISYVQALEKVTEIRPRSTTIFQSPETNIEYMTRVLQIEASKGILLKATVDSGGITHVDKIKF